ncbi:MAG: hypothetical protein DDG59_03975 [Anaerolineae bacterium]|jgi:lipid II:glycine glycyltransferase (peptidoglycan interpeptide bridge formation enzyme)|nr:MAG: hypothetical protein DDG59_03975 [Anaerolineae bacterium]
MMDAAQWNSIVASFPTTHVLQTWQWGLVKQHFGWEVLPQVWKEGEDLIGAALVLRRSISVPILGKWGTLLYLPKGPLLRDWKDAFVVKRVLQEIERLAKEEKAILVKIDPDVVYAYGESGYDWVTKGIWMHAKNNSIALSQDSTVGKLVVSTLSDRGWIFSREQIQFRNTVVLNLASSEEELLRRMKQKTRYNIRLAEKKGIRVREGGVEDFQMLYRMYQETSLRDGFIIRDQDYYLTVWQTFLRASRSPSDMAQANQPIATSMHLSPFAHILIAEYQGEAVAALVLLIFRDKAWYMYGMSSSQHREKMPNYLLHWRAIQFLRQIGIKEYDLWGAPDNFEETDPMFGVYRFKVGFGGETIQHIGAWDFVMNPVKYRLYQEILPRYLGLLRAQRRMMS